MRFEPGIPQIQGYSITITPTCSVASALEKTHTPATVAITFSLKTRIPRDAQILDTRSCRRLILYGSAWYLWVLSTEFTSCHITGSYNSYTVPKCLENLCTPKRCPVRVIQENKQPQNVSRSVLIWSKSKQISRWFKLHGIQYTAHTFQNTGLL